MNPEGLDSLAPDSDNIFSSSRAGVTPAVDLADAWGAESILDQAGPGAVRVTF